MNDNGALGRTTDIRIRQAQLDCKSKRCIIILDKPRLEKIKVRHNLAYNIITEGSALNLSAKSEQIESELCLTEKGTEIVQLLNNKQVGSFCKGKKLNIFVSEQLLNQKGVKLITWQQLNKMREKKGARRKPIWFSAIEGETLANQHTRVIKTAYKTSENNFIACKVILKAISEDRVQDWVVFNNKDQEHSYKFGKVISKPKESIYNLEHWNKTNNSEGYEIGLIKCSGCEINGKGSENSDESSCKIAKGFKGKKRAVPRQMISKVRKSDSMYNSEAKIYKLNCPKEALFPLEVAMRTKPYQEAAVILGSRVDEIINKYIEDDGTKIKLKAIARRLEKYRDLQIFTDGSVDIEATDVGKKRMGIRFVVSRINNQAIEEEVSFAGALEDWPESTRAELEAIGFALLVVLCGFIVRICTDNSSAISVIEKSSLVVGTRNRLKVKNNHIAYSDEKFNEIANSLAKQGRRLGITSRLKEFWSNSLETYPVWNNTVIDRPVRQFVDTLTITLLDTEWAQTSSIANMKAESLDHIAECEVLERIWGNVENEIVAKIIKSCRIESLGGPNITPARLKHVLFEDATEEGGSIERRKNLLRGLINEKALQDFNRNLGLKNSQINSRKRSQKGKKEEQSNRIKAIKGGRKYKEQEGNQKEKKIRTPRAKEETKCREDKLHLGTLVEAG
ncbi:hypothetical protein C2G38_2172191 [Gigaspora rosea]|uniref:RNase H type-1 domain-containing protein n=1 Tax=Gigaspora rosea TaxID=44941 RepID=A0A397VT02_9GLOM|nr:hypothetical protein C2G38_2172191 [Gigaspora rosea]